jgi:Tfp pilus assembly protein FimT
VELLVVLALMALVAAATAPALGGLLSASRLQTAARDLAAQARLARDLAVNRNTSTRLEIDPAAGACRLWQLADRRAGRTQAGWQPAEGGLAAERALPEGVRVTLAGPQAGSVTFAPDGSAQDWFVRLTDDRGAGQLAVRVTAVTGAVAVLGPEDPGFGALVTGGRP